MVNTRTRQEGQEVPIPEGLGYDFEGLSFSLVDPAFGRTYAICSGTPQELFNSFSTALSAPGATYYVNISTGSNANNGSSGSPFKDPWKAIEVANAGGVPTLVYVAVGSGSGNYPRADNFIFGTLGDNSAKPTVDMAFLATGGRVTVGNFDQFSAPSLDGTQTNCYSFTLANADRIVDLANRNASGLYTDLVKVSTAAICNVTPGSWNITAGTVYIHRADGAAVVNTNTRIYRTAPTFQCASNVNLYFGGATDNDGFDLEGGNGQGCLDYSVTTLPAARKAIVASNCSFRYAGDFAVVGNGRGVGVNGIHGVAAFFNCDASGNVSDGFNFHNTASGAGNASRAIRVNCTTSDNGRGTSQSNNGFTLHEDVIGGDFGGYDRLTRGGTIRNINTSKCYLAGTCVENDLGDMMNGGPTRPVAIYADNTAQIWEWHTKINMPAGTKRRFAAASGSAIYYREAWPAGQGDFAVSGATIAPWTS